MSKSIVIVPLGRFNPPHKEHAHLVDAVIKLAKSTHSDAKVYVSRTVNKKKDPLTPQEKIRFLNKMFPGHKNLFDVPPISNPTMVGVLKSLSGKYDTVHIVLGDDRVPEVKAFADKYNGVEYNYDKIEVHSRHSIVNTRVGDLDGVHASDIRKWAQAGDFAKVRDAMSEHLTNADVNQMIHIIQSRLGKTMNESVEINEAEDEIALPSDSEIDKYLDKLTDMGELDLRDEDAMTLDLIVPDEEKKDVHEGVVSSLQRQKRSQKMKSMNKRLARLRKIKAKSMPGGKRLMMRARKAAIMMLRARATGKKNLDYNSLSRSQRITVDNALIQRFGKSLKKTINSYAKKILPRIRSKAQASVAQARSTTNEAFHMFLEDKKVVKKDNPLHIDGTEVDATKVDPTKVDRAAPNPTNVTTGAKKLKQFRMRTEDVEKVPEKKEVHRYSEIRKKHIRMHEARGSAADAVDAGDTNIIYQMRKTIIARGEHEVVFGNKHKEKISVADARKMLDLFDRTRLPADKQKLTVAAGKSLQAFKSVLSHGIPKDKPKISLGGRQMHEWSSWNAIKWNPNNPDAPPGITQANEKKKLAKEYAPRYNPNDPDTPINYTQTYEKKKSGVKEASEDPNQAKRLNQKMDVLLRLGLVDTGELQNYRSALRSSQKHALQSPALRKNLADLLDKLIDLTTQDPATYSRVRYNVVNKELDSQPNPDLRKKAKKSGVAEDVLNQVFAREMSESNNVNRAYCRVNSFIAGGFAAKLDEDLKNTCWKGYTAVGMKMKNGRKVPNCVPKEENIPEDIMAHHADHKVIRVKKAGNFIYRKVYEAPKKTVSESCDLNEAFSAGFELAPFARDYGITVQTSFQHHPDVQEQLDAMEATYKGKSVPLNKPMKGDVKKSKVYVDPDGDGKAKKVNFGDKTLSIKKDQPARKKSYCARSSGQGNLTDKSSANYWSRKAWDC